MDNNHLTGTSHAVIYCRHPDPLIPHLDNDLATQEENCRAYAQNRGYTVETVFAETSNVVAQDHQRPVMWVRVVELTTK